MRSGFHGTAVLARVGFKNSPPEIQWFEAGDFPSPMTRTAARRAWFVEPSFAAAENVIGGLGAGRCHVKRVSGLGRLCFTLGWGCEVGTLDWAAVGGLGV